MADNKKMVEAITSMEEDFAKWYTDVVKKAELIDYSSVRGCMILRPYGYAIWEHIQHWLDSSFKATGHENVYMPMLIPESLLQKEKDHVEGSPTAATKSWPNGCAYAPPLKHCFASITPTSSNLTGICPSCITSGARSSAGKRLPARFCGRWNFCGRKATPCTKLRKRR